MKVGDLVRGKLIGGVDGYESMIGAVLSNDFIDGERYIRVMWPDHICSFEWYKLEVVNENR